MKIAMFSTKAFDREYFDEFNTPPKHEITYYEAPLRDRTANLAQGYDGVCVFVNDDVDLAVIKKLKDLDLKLIALRCAGFNNVDLHAAKKYSIPVVRVPAYSPYAVAEHAVALILTLNRKTHKSFNRIREHNFSLERLVGFDLHGKTVGVIGTGQIGGIFCRNMLGFGCEVIAFDQYPDERLSSAGVRYVEFEDLLSKSDIISLHCPLTPETFHLIGKKEFSMMKKGVMLINTSRGALINTKAAIKALKRAQLGYLGIDVYEQEEHLFFRDLSEKIIQDDLISRLLTFPNVLITAHQGFFTREALEEIARVTLDNLTAFENGDHLKNEIMIR
ncbi:MAG: 2-hydroxyacid dehydrogenase [Saprospiraceae bacterium]|nr:2-hydroxyacid dehydrogenase [Saprospiraceae bacterium]